MPIEIGKYVVSTYLKYKTDLPPKIDPVSMSELGDTVESFEILALISRAYQNKTFSSGFADVEDDMRTTLEPLLKA